MPARPSSQGPTRKVARTMVTRLILLDTNVVIDLLEGNPRGQEAQTFFESLGEDALISYSLMTRFELLAVPDIARNQSARQFLEHLTPLELSMNVMDRAADILVVSHGRKRRKIPDALIAATAIEYDAELLTHDERDFKKIPGLNLVHQ